MAEQRVIANLNGIDEQIRQLNKSAKQAAQSVKDVSAYLQFDPQNVDLVTRRFAALRDELAKNEEVVAEYQRGIERLEEENRQLEALGDLTADERKQYDANVRAINKYSAALENAKRRVEYLKAASDEKVEADKKAAIAQEELRKKQEKTTKAFEDAEKATKKIAVAMVALVGVLAKTVKSSLELGTELYNLSVRYNTNAQDIQIWNRALQLATGQTDLFTTAVNTMIKGLSQISAGRGVAYKKSLQNIGLAYKDLEGLGTADRFKAIVEALGETADANVRLEAAQQLLGESGQSIAEMFDKEGFSLDAYLEKAEKFGVITQESAEALTELGFDFEAAKSQMSVATAQLTIALAPALQVIVNLITNVSKFVKNLADAFGGMNGNGARFVVWLGSTIILLPKMISLIKGMVLATQTLNLATAKWQIVLNAVALAIILIIQLIAVFSSSAKKALEDVNKLTGAASDLSSAGEDFGANVESVSSTSNYRQVDVNVEMHASGDAEDVDAAAANVAQITVDEIQRALGDLVK